MRLHDPQRVGETDAVGPGFDGRIANFHQEFEIGAGGILRCIAHLQSQAAGIGDVLADDLERLFLGFVQFGIQVDFRGGIKDGDPVRAAGFGLVDAGACRDRMGHDLRLEPQPGDPLDGLGYARRNGRVARFDHVHAHLVEHPGNFDLFIDRKVDIRRLFAFAQGGIQDFDHDA